MRDFRDAKVMAHSLRDALKVKAVEITHSESLELIAKTFGYENWNILSAKIDTAQPRSGSAAGHQGPTPPADVRPVDRRKSSRSPWPSWMAASPSGTATAASGGNGNGTDGGYASTRC